MSNYRTSIPTSSIKTVKANEGKTIGEMAAAAGESYYTTWKICKDFDIQYRKEKLQSKRAVRPHKAKRGYFDETKFKHSII